MTFSEFTFEDIEKAAEILAERHRCERKFFPQLKKEFEDSANTKKVLADIMENELAMGICAYEGAVLKGFILSVIKTEGVLGRCAYVSYESCGVSQEQSYELYRSMYDKISRVWIENGALFHYAEIPAGSGKEVRAWLKLSFAFQQVYGVASLARKEINAVKDISVRQADKEDGKALREIADVICSCQAGSPTYASCASERVRAIKYGYENLPLLPCSIVLVAYRDKRLVSMQYADLKQEPLSMMLPENAVKISVSATAEDSRGMGIGTLITETMFNMAIDKGYQNVMTDWRIANPYSSTFWENKGFKPVAYRMYRQIDERVYWAKGV